MLFVLLGLNEDPVPLKESSDEDDRHPHQK